MSDKLKERLDRIEKHFDRADTSDPIHVDTKICVEKITPMLLRAVEEIYRYCDDTLSNNHFPGEGTVADRVIKLLESILLSEENNDE